MRDQLAARALLLCIDVANGGARHQRGAQRIVEHE